MLPQLEPLAQKLAENRLLLDRAVDGLTEQQMNLQPRPGEYSGRQVLAHLAGAEKGMTRLVQTMATGKNPRLRPGFQLDQYNTGHQEKRIAMSVADLRAELDESRAELLTLMQTLKPEDLDKRGEHPVTGDETVLGVLKVLQSHERGHIDDFALFARLLKASPDGLLPDLEPTVDQLQMTRQMLRGALQGLTLEQMKVRLPGSDWSIKDALAHLAGNEKLLTRVLENIATGSAETEIEFDNDAVNAEQVAWGRSLSLEQVWQQLAENRSELLGFLRSLSPEQLERRGSHPYEGMMTVREFLVVLYSHEATHVREIVEWARQLKHREQA